MELPKIDSDDVAKMFPCHPPGLYFSGGPGYDGDALDLLRTWVHTGLLSPANYAWVVFRDEFLPERLMHEFSFECAKSFLGTESAPAVETKRGLLAIGSHTLTDLKLELLEIKEQLTNCEASLIAYRHRLMDARGEKKKLLEDKVTRYADKFNKLSMARFAASPSAKGSASGVFLHMHDMGLGKECLAILEEILSQETLTERFAALEVTNKNVSSDRWVSFKDLLSGFFN